MLTSTLKRGFSPVVVALAGLVLALALLGPSAAVAKPGGTDRPITATESGTNVIDVASGAFVVDVTGTASHLGKVTAHYTGVATPSGPAPSASAASSVEVAANGDKLYVTLSGSCDARRRLQRAGHAREHDHRRHRALRARERRRGGHVHHGDALLRRGDADVGHQPLPGGHVSY